MDVETEIKGSAKKGGENLMLMCKFEVFFKSSLVGVETKIKGSAKKKREKTMLMRKGKVFLKSSFVR